jgi:hypothetical protein
LMVKDDPLTAVNAPNSLRRFLMTISAMVIPENGW